MRAFAILGVTLALVAGCSGSVPTPAPPRPSAQPTQTVVTPTSPRPTAVATERATVTSPGVSANPTQDPVTAYIAGRNAICEDASLDVADINAQYIDAPGATRAMILEGVKKVQERSALAHEQLDALTVPPVFQTFVDNEIAAREDPVGIAAYEELLRAIKDGDDLEEAEAAFDAVMNPINAGREGTEDAYGFVHCA